jgi:hypothetical protein
MRQKFTLAMMLLCAILSGCTQTETSEESTDDTSSLVNLGDTLPAFSVTDNAGHVYSNSTLKGHISVIVFFNTTCPDCQHELPVNRFTVPHLSEAGIFQTGSCQQSTGVISRQCTIGRRRVSVCHIPPSHPVTSISCLPRRPFPASTLAIVKTQ